MDKNLKQYSLDKRDTIMERIQLNQVNMNGIQRRKMNIIENYTNSVIKMIIQMTGHQDFLVTIICGEINKFQKFKKLIFLNIYI